MLPSKAEEQPGAESTCSAHNRIIFEYPVTSFISFDSSNIRLHVLDAARVGLWCSRASFIITNVLLVERSVYWIRMAAEYVDMTPKRHMCLKLHHKTSCFMVNLHIKLIYYHQ